MHHAIRRPERERAYILLLRLHNCYCVMLWWQQVRREKIGERMKFLQDLVPGCNKVWKNNNKLCSPTSAWFLLVQKFWSFLVVVMMCIQYFHVFISCLFRAFPLFFFIFKKVEGELVWSLNLMNSFWVCMLLFELQITGKAMMLDEIINYVQSLQRQVEVCRTFLLLLLLLLFLLGFAHQFSTLMEFLGQLLEKHYCSNSVSTVLHLKQQVWHW